MNIERDAVLRMAKEAGFISIDDWSKVDKEFERFADLVRAERDKDYLQLVSDFAGKFDATKENVFVAIKAIATGVYEL